MWAWEDVFQVKCVVSGCWSLRVSNAGGLRVCEGINWREKSMAFHRLLLSYPPRNGTRVGRVHSKRSALDLGMRIEDWTQRNGGRGEDLQLPTCFPC